MTTCVATHADVPETRNSISAIHTDGDVVVLVVDGRMMVSLDRGDAWTSVGGQPFSDAPSAREGVTFLHGDALDERLYFVFDRVLYQAALPADAAD